MVAVLPMLLSSTRSAPAGSDWVLEPKWDGFRFLYRLAEKGQATCWTRHGNRHDRKLPYIDAELRHRFPRPRRTQPPRRAELVLRRLEA